MLRTNVPNQILVLLHYNIFRFYNLNHKVKTSDMYGLQFFFQLGVKQAQ